MHLLAAQPGAITDGEEAVDLGQTPGEMVYISAADTELALLADASRQLMAEGQNLPTLRLANLMQLGHNMSVDLYVDEVIQHAKISLSAFWAAMAIGLMGLSRSPRFVANVASSWQCYPVTINPTRNWLRIQRLARTRCTGSGITGCMADLRTAAT